MEGIELPQGYFDNYEERATIEDGKEMELEIVANIPDGGPYFDRKFDSSPTSLYIDPLSPPTGCIPYNSVVWNRISGMEVEDCFNPVVFMDEEDSGFLVQGGIENGWFVGAMSVLSSFPHLLHPILVSDTYLKERGVATFKFYKGGRWVFVSVDDRLPCSFSGSPYFCKSSNNNEVWMCLVEKAYAKLHGGYEAIRRGFVEHALKDLTGGCVAHYKIGRKEDGEEEDKKQGEADHDELWEKIHTLFHNHPDDAIICVSRNERSKLHNPTHNQGLVCGRVYGISQVHQLVNGSSEHFDGIKPKLCKLFLRNLFYSSSQNHNINMNLMISIFDFYYSFV